MRWLYIAATAALAAGCQVAPKSNCSTISDAPATVQTEETSGRSCATARPNCAPPHVTINMPKEICLKSDCKDESKAAPAKVHGEVAADQAVAGMAVQQETLLVPRMVYVPFTTAVPVAPARLLGVRQAAVGTPLILNQSSAGAQAATEGAGRAAAASASPEVTAEQFLRLAAVVEELAKQMKQNPPAAAQSCSPPLLQGPCLTPPFNQIPNK